MVWILLGLEKPKYIWAIADVCITIHIMYIFFFSFFFSVFLFLLFSLLSLFENVFFFCPFQCKASHLIQSSNGTNTMQN